MAERHDEHIDSDIIARIEANYKNTLGLLRSRLDLRSDLAQRSVGENWSVELASCLFAYGIYGNGCAILALYQADLGRQIPAIVRAQFEAVVKLMYCKHFPKKSADFLVSEPFRRWMTARGKELSAEQRDLIHSSAWKLLERIRVW